MKHNFQGGMGHSSVEDFKKNNLCVILPNVPKML
jgi:hypothetical protein